MAGFVTVSRAEDLKEGDMRAIEIREKKVDASDFHEPRRCLL